MLQRPFALITVVNFMDELVTGDSERLSPIFISSGFGIGTGAGYGTGCGTGIGGGVGAILVLKRI